MLNNSEDKARARAELLDGRDLYEVANQLGGYVDMGTEPDLAAFLLRESKAAATLADEVVRLRLADQERAPGVDDEYMSVSISRDGVVTSHNAFDADYDEMVLATQKIVDELTKRLSDRARCPYSHGGALRRGDLPSPAPGVDEALRGAEACQRCGSSNPSWSAPSPLWNAVIRGGSINGEPLYADMLCMSCFALIAEAAGIARGWRLMATEVNVPLETTTPSGRAWNEQTWLWEDLAATPIANADWVMSEALKALEQACNDLRTVGDDYPGSSCHKWCHERAKAAWEMVHPWEHCPSTHCERAHECRGPSECSASRAALFASPAHVAVSDVREELAKLFWIWGPGRGTECEFENAPTSLRDRCNHFSDAAMRSLALVSRPADTVGGPTA